MSETKPKKMVSRNVAIALGIICIVLAAGLAGAFVYFVQKMNDRDSTISSLNSQLTNLQSVLDLNESDVVEANQTVSLDQGSLWEASFTASYSGYVSVTIYNSTTNPTEVIVSYTNRGGHQNLPMELSNNETATFPVVFSMTDPSLWVSVDFSFPHSGYSFVVTIIYYY